MNGSCLAAPGDKIVPADFDALLKQMNVCGYRILVRTPFLRSSLITLNQNIDTRNAEFGKVITVGPLAYNAKDFEYAWCKEGDWIYFSTYESQAFTFMDHRCYFLNDNKVNGVIPETLYEYFLKNKE